MPNTGSGCRGTKAGVKNLLKKVDPFFAEVGICSKKVNDLNPLFCPGAPADAEKCMNFLVRLKDTKRKRKRNFGRGLPV